MIFLKKKIKFLLPKIRFYQNSVTLVGLALAMTTFMVKLAVKN